MTGALIYIMESAACLALSCIAGKLITRNDRGYSGTRAYWLISIIMALVLPAAAQMIPDNVLLSPAPEHTAAAGAGIQEVSEAAGTAAGGTVIDATAADKALHIVAVTYLAGAALMLLLYLISYMRLLTYITRCGKAVSCGMEVRLSAKDIEPFCWMDSIVMSGNDIGDEYVLRHEYAHRSMRHSWDILLSDILITLQWFNPSAYLVKKELLRVHEYQADAYVISSGADAAEYEMKILERASGRVLGLTVNQFGRISVKDRLQMMISQGRSGSGLWKPLCIGTVAVLSLAAFASPAARAVSGVLEALDGSRTADVTLHLDGNYLYGGDKMENTTEESDSGLIQFLPPEAFALVKEPELEAGQTAPQFNGEKDLMAFSRWLNGRIKYPEEDRSAGRTGKAQISFTVNADGSVSDIRTDFATTPAMEKELLGLVMQSSLMWRPGTDNGRPVPTRLEVPAAFRINE